MIKQGTIGSDAEVAIWIGGWFLGYGDQLARLGVWWGLGEGGVGFRV